MARNNAYQLMQWKNPVHWLALGFGTGLAPVAPGTFGSLAAFPLFWFMQPLSYGIYLGLVLLFAILGIWLCDRTARDFGVHDHGAIVWDEVVGMLIAMFALPTDWRWYLAAFLLFRFFDILKPWPIKWLDRRVGGGFGIMIDDVLAGLFALAVLQSVQVIFF